MLFPDGKQVSLLFEGVNQLADHASCEYIPWDRINHAAKAHLP